MHTITWKLLAATAACALVSAQPASATPSLLVATAVDKASNGAVDQPGCGGPGAVPDCATIAYALTQIVPGGIITVRPGSIWPTLTISKSVTIRSTDANTGWGVVGGDGIVINAGPTDKVVLDGFFFITLGGGVTGINIQNAGEVLITRSVIRGFQTGLANSSTSQSTRVTLDSDRVLFNGVGVSINATPGFGHVKIFDTTMLTNATAGVQVTGAGNDAMLANVKILGSTKGVSLISGGVVYSYGNNLIVTGDPVTPRPLS